MYLKKIKNFEIFFSFSIGTILALTIIVYKYLNLGIVIDKNFESFDYIRPALVFLKNHSFVDFMESLNPRLPAYPLLIAFIFEIFGENNYFAILIFQALIYGLIVAILMKIKNFFTKDFFWISLLIIIFNLNILWSTSIVLPGILLVFFISCGLFFFIRFIKEKKSFKNLFFGSIFFGFAYLTKPIALYIPFSISLFLLFFFYFQKKYNFSKIILFSLLPFIIILLISSPIYISNYKTSGELILSHHKGNQLLFFVYPCVVNKKGCGERDLSAVKKAEQLSKERIGEFHKNIISNNLESPYKSDSGRKIIESKIREKIFYELINELDKYEIIKSLAFTYTKLMTHTSLISVLAAHKINYIDYKLNFNQIEKNFNAFTLFWLIFQILLIFLRIIQIYGLISVFTKDKKNLWVILFFLSVGFALIFPTLGISNFRYRMAVEPILILSTIIGIKNISFFNKKRTGSDLLSRILR